MSGAEDWLAGANVGGYFEGIGFGWLIYGPCETCGVARKHPCVDRTSPHPGRQLWAHLQKAEPGPELQWKDVGGCADGRGR